MGHGQSLAILRAGQGRFDEARALLDAGLDQVKTHPIDLAQLHCARGHVECLAGDLVRASKALTEAEGIAETSEVSITAELI